MYYPIVKLIPTNIFDNLLTMGTATLQFKNESDLEGFVIVVKCTFSELNLEDFILVCNCDDAEIELAERAFNAKVLKVENQHQDTSKHFDSLSGK